LLAALGCSSSSSSDDPDGTEGAPNMGEGFLLGDEGLPGEEVVEPGMDDQRPQCLGETHQAEAIGLDMFVMLDISGSMLDVLPTAQLLAPATTKWDAVRDSLESFVQDPETADIGIGLQYFPQSNDGVPFSCASNDECGPGGPCTNSLCVSSGELEIADDGADPFGFVQAAGVTARFCAADSECGGLGESCRTMIGECIFPPGVVAENPDGAFLNVSQNPATSLVSPLCGVQADCDGLPGTACEEIGVCTTQLIKCSPSIGCPPGAGECAPFPYSCLNQTSCDVASYAAPAVAISESATRSDELLTSLREQVPQGQTPTGPALSGALEQARIWAEQNPGRQVVTVLATDGFPTVCEPLEIPGIAEVAGLALDAARPVRTFVIGVFGNADLGGDGQQRLDTIARAGGTDRAIVINTAGNVSGDFLEALNLIRNTAVSCDFQLDEAASLDFDRVNLQVTDGTGSQSELVNVGDASACGDDAGWYYVRDAAGIPFQLSVCPSTCATFMGEGVRADLQIGCATRIR
jgi:hypothetical protein